MTSPFYEPPPDPVAPRLARWADWLLPIACLGCRRAIPGPGSPPLGLCAACRGRLHPVPPGCAVCGEPGGLAAGGLCARCRARPPAFSRLRALYLYAPPLDAVIHGLKFRRLDYLGRHLGGELAARFGADLDAVDAVVPLPLHWWRRLARGFDQAEGIARALAAAIDRPFARALARRRATRAQTGLGRRDRRANVEGAFRVPRPERIAGARVLLVDDVATTGATLEAAAAALVAAGAARVEALAAARAAG